VSIDGKLTQVYLANPKAIDEKPRTFTFDMVYGDDSKQQEVYDECGFGMVENVIEGYNCTMFAYG
jgi:kinesin family member 11